ncbi:hypothetical protein NEMIN01_2472, partial [Nematocida minor]|uniref:uncharacterized protein n=1 Tax=Nematocida minor TaxID=1912983 RepID=UPI00221E774A
MALHETVLEYVRKEIEGEAYNRMELYKAVEEIPEKEKKQALRRICSLIKKSILESVLPVAECYTRWLKTERSFQCVLSALNIQQGRIKKLTSLSLHKTVTRSVLQLTKIKKDEEIRTLVQMVRDSMQGEKEEQTCRALRIQLFLLTRIKEEKRVEREILRVYTSAAEVHIQEVKEAYKAHTPSDIKMKIENVKKTPGLFIFAKGLTKKLKRSVQQQIAALAIDRSVYSAQDVLVLLKSNEVGAVSEILNCKLPKQSRLSLRDMVQAAIFQYTAENRYDKLLEIYKKPWTGRAPQIVKSIVACISKEAVKSSLEEYCRIVTSKIRLLFLSK